MLGYYLFIAKSQLQPQPMIYSAAAMEAKLDAIVWDNEIQDPYSATLGVIENEVYWWTRAFIMPDVRQWAEAQSRQYKGKCDLIAERKSNSGPCSIYSHYNYISNRYKLVHAATTDLFSQ